MDANRFDVLARTLNARTRRRFALDGLFAAVLVGMALGRGELVIAKKRRKHKKPKGPKGPRDGARVECALQRYDAKTLVERGLGESASHIDLTELAKLVSRDRPARDRHDVHFFPVLNQINAAVAKHRVTLRATSAYRNEKAQGGANPTVTQSNHMAGHAIDFDFVHDGGVCDWPCKRTETAPRKCLIGADKKTVRRADGCLERARDASGTPPGTITAGMQQLPTDVRNAILEVESAGFRWGGRFASTGYDPIHFDDNLSKEDFDAWQERVDALLAAEAFLRKLKRVCPIDEACNVTTGLCECEAGVSCEGDRILDLETCDCICPPVTCNDGQAQDPDTCECVESVCRAGVRGKGGAIEVAGVACGKRCCSRCETCETVTSAGRQGKKKKKRKTCVPVWCPALVDFPAVCNPETGICEECCPTRDACREAIIACIGPVVSGPASECCEGVQACRDAFPHLCTPTNAACGSCHPIVLVPCACS
jgi:hypothetical protein